MRCCKNPIANPLPRRYVSGESYRYLGRQYCLKVVENSIERVQLSRGFLTVSVADTNDKQRIAELLDNWFYAQAKRIFEERLAAQKAAVILRLGVASLSQRMVHLRLQASEPDEGIHHGLHGRGNHRVTSYSLLMTA